MKYVIASAVVTDEIRYADGKHVDRAAGGAGIYALCGVKLWDDDVTIVTGVGEDYDALYGEWYRRNRISMDGLLVKGEKTPHTVIQYFEDGEREETPLYGPGHFAEMEVRPEELKPYFTSAEGIYIFKNSNEEFWKKIISYRENAKAKVMWEIACDAAYRENKEHVKSIASHVDILSINLTEAKALLGLEKLEDIICEFQTWDTGLVFLRRGAEGSVMITAEEYAAVPSEKDADVKDPTGGGNSSSGAVLCGYCEKKSLEECARMGNLSAVMCLAQYGVPEEISLQMQQAAREKLESGGNEIC